MTFSATIKIQYQSKWEQTRGIYDEEMLPEENITFEVPAEDLNTIQLFSLFNKFMLAIGHSSHGIDKGALSLVFNEMRTKEEMRKAAEEFDLKLVEDLSINEKWYEQNMVDPHHWEKAYFEYKRNAEKEIRDLKAKLSRAENPDNPNYTDEEIDAMNAENEVTAAVLKNADVVCRDCGSKYGTYSVGCSSTWQGTCNVCGQTKSVTEVRDYGYLSKGIEELTK